MDSKPIAALVTWARTFRTQLWEHVPIAAMEPIRTPVKPPAQAAFLPIGRILVVLLVAGADLVTSEIPLDSVLSVLLVFMHFLVLKQLALDVTPGSIFKMLQRELAHHALTVRFPEAIRLIALCVLKTHGLMQLIPVAVCVKRVSI
jgi:hypothetical protein